MSQMRNDLREQAFLLDARVEQFFFCGPELLGADTLGADSLRVSVAALSVQTNEGSCGAKRT